MAKKAFIFLSIKNENKKTLMVNSLIIKIDFKNRGCPVVINENKGSKNANQYAFFLLVERRRPVSTIILIGSNLYNGNEKKWEMAGKTNINNRMNASINKICNTPLSTLAK
jgi:hypothetical protein